MFVIFECVLCNRKFKSENVNFTFLDHYFRWHQFELYESLRNEIEEEKPFS